MRQVKMSHEGYQQPSTKPSSFILQAWNNIFCREFPIKSSWGDECDCLVGVCLHACVCLVCDWGSSWLFSSVQYALRYAEMRHKYCWIKWSTLSNPAFTMESLITQYCALGVCVWARWSGLKFRGPECFFARLLVYCSLKWAGLRDSIRWVPTFFQPVRPCFPIQRWTDVICHSEASLMVYWRCSWMYDVLVNSGGY